MEKFRYFVFITLLSLNLTYGQASECHFVIELDNFNFENHAVGDTGYFILSEKIMIKYIVLSCKGDCYIQEVMREGGRICVEGYYSATNEIDTVESKIFDPTDPSKYEVTTDYLTYPMKSGLWIYRDELNCNVVERRAIYKEGKKLFEF